jgi:hypothetical protein
VARHSLGSTVRKKGKPNRWLAVLGRSLKLEPPKFDALDALLGGSFVHRMLHKERELIWLYKYKTLMLVAIVGMKNKFTRFQGNRCYHHIQWRTNRSAYDVWSIYWWIIRGQAVVLAIHTEFHKPPIHKTNCFTNTLVFIWSAISDWRSTLTDSWELYINYQLDALIIIYS